MENSFGSKRNTPSPIRIIPETRIQKTQRNFFPNLKEVRAWGFSVRPA
jgi:hypothetical protein